MTTRRTRCINLRDAAAVAAASAPRAATPRLRRVEAGMYETEDGRYGVVKVGSVGEHDLTGDEIVTSGGWAITEGGARYGEELPTTYATKRDAALALAGFLAR